MLTSGRAAIARMLGERWTGLRRLRRLQRPIDRARRCDDYTPAPQLRIIDVTGGRLRRYEAVEMAITPTRLLNQ